MEWLDQEPDATKAMLTWARDELAYQTITDHLTSAGLRIIDRSWHCAEGRIDILAAERRVLVVCQVKIGSARSRSPLRAITRAKDRQLRRLGLRWMTTHGVLYDEIRVDIVRLLHDPAGGFTVKHVRGVA
jgi:putative endonuclease